MNRFIVPILVAAICWVFFIRYRYNWMMDKRRMVSYAVWKYNNARRTTGTLAYTIPYWESMEPWQVTMIRFWDYEWRHMVNKKYLRRIELYIEEK